MATYKKNETTWKAGAEAPKKVAKKKATKKAAPKPKPQEYEIKQHGRQVFIERKSGEGQFRAKCYGTEQAHYFLCDWSPPDATVVMLPVIEGIPYRFCVQEHGTDWRIVADQWVTDISRSRLTEFK